MTEISQETPSWFDRPVFPIFSIITREKAIFILITLLAIISRLNDLGVRVMSHDENLHVYFSWLLAIGKGYQHTPLMHGPLQFHLLALMYSLVGASDFTARLPHAIASILSIVMLWKFRHFLGRTGTLVAAGMVLISPFMLYAILRYFETGKRRYLILLTIITALHFTSKETSFIYTAQALLFLAVNLINRVSRVSWKNRRTQNIFFVFLSIGILLLGAVLGLTVYNRVQTATDASQTAAPILPGIIPGATSAIASQFSIVSFMAILAGLAILIAAVLLVQGYGWKNLCRERSFDMLILLGTFVLPQLAAFPASALGWNPLEYQFAWPGWNLPALWAQAPVKTAIVFLILCLLTFMIGLLWDKKNWLGYTALFWGIYTIFYTSLFSNWQGFFTGTVGSLGYWLQQQGVHRGGQPWYYYLLIQVPIYEYLPALGVWLAIYMGLRQKSSASLPLRESIEQISNAPSESTSLNEITSNSEGNFTFPLLLWWSLSSLFAYTLAGEKMPWLTVHIALPMILLTGWGLGQVVERVNWQKFRKERGFTLSISLVVLIVSFTSSLVVLLGGPPPFQGKTQDQLVTTGSFLLSAVVALASAGGLYFMSRVWKFREVQRIAILVTFTLLAVLTCRSAVRAAYGHPNDATEYLVYAHGASGIKDVMEQISMISSRIAGEQNIKVAYDNNLPNQGVSWSFKWYLRNFPNAVSFDKPDRSLRDALVIIVDQQNFENIKPIVGDNYYRTNYIRMVWPNQDYFGLTWPIIRKAILNRAMREAIFQIWFNRDYSAYAKTTGKSGLNLNDWQPSASMQLFVRKDIADQIWEYGISSQSVPLQADPYEKGTIILPADLIFGADGQLNAPRDFTIAPDSSIYVADSLNSRILHFDANGNLVQTLGQPSLGCPYATIPPKDVPVGTFCEPWAVAISPDGQWIYVADTWNHRIQKLSSDGKPVLAWGMPNYDPVSSDPFGLWGPRDIIVDSQGHILVTDTGNKRVLIYDDNGNFIFQLGGEGTGVGQFDEPVGLALDSAGNLYIADTWNQRVQVFSPSSDKKSYSNLVQWGVFGWSSQSLDNKPYIAVDKLGHVFVTDPDSFRVLEFDTSGVFIRAWGEYGSSSTSIGMPSGISVDEQGRIWVSDTANNRIMRFVLP